LVVSEPSNPYRAGIASLFTKEYYQSASARINDKGMFVQWVQSYNVDSRTVQTIYATLLSVFGHVETWNTAAGDMLLVASRQPIEHDINRLRGIVDAEPFHSAMAWTWGTTGVEGLYSHYIVNADFARFFTDFPGIKLNTDDRTLIEFGFARAANMPTRFSMNELRDAARSMGLHRPKSSNGSVDWDRVDEELAQCQMFEGSGGPLRQAFSSEPMQRLLAVRKYMEGDLGAAATAWRAQPREPRGPMELTVVANALASLGDESAVKYIEQLRGFQPVEADVVLGRLRIRQGKAEAGTDALVAAFKRFHEDPWPRRLAMRRGLTLALAVGRSNPALAKRIGESLRTPFAACSQNETRQDVLVQLAGAARDLPMMVEALEQYEPFTPWKGESLSARANAYKAAGHKLEARAREQLSEYRRGQGEAVFDEMMAPSAGSREPGTGTAMLEK
jgi:hypothetical protein